MESRNLYDSFPLLQGTNTIRVLHVVAPSTSTGDDTPLSGHLQVVNLDENPSFSALSYVWGIERPGHPISTILCSGVSLRITTNCRSALLQLRKKYKRFSIWIDAICINQNDEIEKTFQIPLMGEIYSQAETVYIWLGEGTEASKRAMSYLKHLSLEDLCTQKEYKDKTGHRSIQYNYPGVCYAWWSLFTAGWHSSDGPTAYRSSFIKFLKFVRLIRSDKSLSVSWEDLQDLFDRPWINRMWTYQEILLACNPVIICGDSYISWTQFALGITFLESSGINYPTGIAMVRTLPAWREIVIGREHLLKRPSTSGSEKDHKSQSISIIPLLRSYQMFMIRIPRCGAMFFHITLYAILALSILCLMSAFIILGTQCNGKNLLVDPHLSGPQETSTPICPDAHQLCFGGQKVICMGDQVTYHQVPSRTLGITFVAISMILLTFIPLISISFRTYWRSKCLERPHHLMQFKLRTRKDPYEGLDLVGGLCLRRAKYPEDKAFAVRAILQRFQPSLSFTLPDYDTPISKVYREFSTQLLQATRSLRPLVPASIHNFPDEPSWTPNWFAKFPHFWLDPLISNNEHKNATPDSSWSWSWDQVLTNGIRVKALRFSKVNATYRFFQAAEVYNDSEMHIHLKNIRTAQDLLRKCRHGNTISGDFFAWFGDLHELGIPLEIQVREAFMWGRFFETLENIDAERILQLFQGDGEMGIVTYGLVPNDFKINLKGLFRTHVKICNTFARHENNMFVTEPRLWNHSGNLRGHIDGGVWISEKTVMGERKDYWSKRLGEFDSARREEALAAKKALEATGVRGSVDLYGRTIGICTGKVKVDDTVLLISGLPVPLIVRNQDKGVRLVSPAFVLGAMKGQSWDEKQLEDFLIL